jgi:hypothetical protein
MKFLENKKIKTPTSKGLDKVGTTDSAKVKKSILTPKTKPPVKKKVNKNIPKEFT